VVKTFSMYNLHELNMAIMIDYNADKEADHKTYIICMEFGHIKIIKNEQKL